MTSSDHLTRFSSAPKLGFYGRHSNKTTWELWQVLLVWSKTLYIENVHLCIYMYIIIIYIYIYVNDFVPLFHTDNVHLNVSQLLLRFLPTGAPWGTGSSKDSDFVVKSWHIWDPVSGKPPQRRMLWNVKWYIGPNKPQTRTFIRTGQYEKAYYVILCLCVDPPKLRENSFEAMGLVRRSTKLVFIQSTNFDDAYQGSFFWKVTLDHKLWFSWSWCRF